MRRRQSIGACLWAAFSPVDTPAESPIDEGREPPKASRSLHQAIKRLDTETEMLMAELGRPFHETLADIVERMR